MNAFIKLLMDERGINQKELAEILRISPSAVSQWKECKMMNVETLFRLSKLFQVTVEELVAEKPIAETHEQKWDRLYNLDGYEWAELVEAEDENVISKYLEKLCYINSQFFELLYKKMAGRATSFELNELAVLRTNFNAYPHQSAYFYDKHLNYPTNEMEIWIAEILNEAVGIENEGAIIWELQRIYRNIKMVSFEQICETQNDSLFYMWYNTLTQEKKDDILTDYNCQGKDNAILYQLIKRDGRILYVERDFPQINFDRSDLEKFEGMKKPLENLDSVKIIFSDMYKYRHIPYKQYQNIINKSAMERVVAEYKYKKKEPIKYWEFIQQRGV